MEMSDGGAGSHLSILYMCLPVAKVCASVGISCEYR